MPAASQDLCAKDLLRSCFRGDLVLDITRVLTRWKLWAHVIPGILAGKPADKDVFVSSDSKQPYQTLKYAPDRIHVRTYLYTGYSANFIALHHRARRVVQNPISFLLGT